MKLPTRRLKPGVVAAMAGSLGLGMVPILATTASAASPLVSANNIAVLDQPTYTNGSSGQVLPEIVIGSGVTYAAGDTITIQIAQPGLGVPGEPGSTNANCSDPSGAAPSTPGNRRFVAFTPNQIPLISADEATGGGFADTGFSSSTVGVPITGYCNVQDGGARDDILTITFRTAVTGPIVLSNVRIDIGAGDSDGDGVSDQAGSASRGALRMFIYGSATVGGLNGENGVIQLTTADGTVIPATPFGPEDAPGWVTDLTLAGNAPPRALVTNTGPGPKTLLLSPVTIQERVVDAIDAAGGAGATLCIDLAAPESAAWSPLSLSATGSTSSLAADAIVPPLVIGDGPFLAGTTDRLQFTINSQDPSVLSTFTITGLAVTVDAGESGALRAILTDCGDATGNRGAPRTGGSEADASGADADTIGNFSGPNPLDYNNTNRVLLGALLLQDRAGGNDRVATARILQQERYGVIGSPGLSDDGELEPGFGGTRTAIVATADNFPDALAATYAAGRVNAAILLVRESTDALSQVFLALANLGVKNVLIAGGEAAVPASIATAIADRDTTCTFDSPCGGTAGMTGPVLGDPRVPLGTNINVTRVNDPDNDTRYGTMRLFNILQSLPPSIGGLVSQQVQPKFAPNIGGLTARTAFVASGANFPDALAAGVRAYANGIPLVLTDPASLSPEARATLQDLETQQVIILGGTSAVSQAVEDAIRGSIASGGLNLPVVRIGGDDRQDTAAKLDAFARAIPSVTTSGLGLGTALETVLLARGDVFADALTVAVQGTGPLAGIGTDPLDAQYFGQASVLLTESPTALGTVTRDYLAGKLGQVFLVKCIGLQAAISDAVCTDAVNAIAGIPAT